MGYKTMDALRSHSDEVLNFQQQIGLKHYQDFMTKIPRYAISLSLSGGLVSDV
jgi:hypothetical protein